MDCIETPSEFQSILWTFVRHTVSRCLIFPALPKVTRSRGQIKSKVNTLGFLLFLPSGQYGLCFGYFFSGTLPLRSHFNSPPFGVCFRESVIFRLHSEIDQIHVSIDAQCGTACLPTGDCHTHHIHVCQYCFHWGCWTVGSYSLSTLKCVKYCLSHNLYCNISGIYLLLEVMNFFFVMPMLHFVLN